MAENLAPDSDAAPAARFETRMGTSRFLIVGALMLALLFIGYWFLIRADYVPVLTEVPPEEAAEVVKVLDAKKIPYRLSDGGTTISIESSQADQARLELMGSELPIRGQVGFELFNQSDMGLTDFAQKINYQRALQGELARTILLLDGIKSVRVHLGLPEHGLFRDEQEHPKASVTLILTPGASLTESRVSGIQRLVSGAVPDMTAQAVSVLDGTGRVVSMELVAPAATTDAIVANYRERVSSAIRTNQPSLRFSVNVSARARRMTMTTRPGSDETRAATMAPAATGALPRGDPDYVVNVRVTTAEQLDDVVRKDLIDAIQSTVDVDASRGDSLVFLVGEPVPSSVEPQSTALSDRVVTKAAGRAPERSVTFPGGPWLLIFAAGIVGIFLLAITVVERRRSRIGAASADDLTTFAEELRQRIAAGAAPARE